MELRHLRYFVAVAETQNMRKAADILNISQPPLSTQISDLEHELGTRLFDRIKNRLVLTDAGYVFLEKAKQILSAADNAKKSTQLAALGQIGELEIHFNSSSVTGPLQDTIRAYQNRYPHVRLNLQQSTVEMIVQGVKTKKVDIGFVRYPTTLDGDVILQPITREKYVAALPEGHCLAKKDKVDLKQLVDMPFITYPRITAPNVYDQVMQIFTQQNLFPTLGLEAPEQLTIAGLVAAGMGYSIAPECMTKISVPGVVHRPILKAQKAMTGIGIVTNANCRTLVKRFLECL